MDHQQLSLLLYIVLFCLILYLARILLFIIFTGKFFLFFIFRVPTKPESRRAEFEEREKVREETHKNKKK